MPCRTHRPAFVLALLALLVATPAHAIVRQPDGTMVPVGGSLQMYLTARGESINAVNDAAVEPQRFVPGCQIRFTVIVRDTSYANAFGWYNITPGRAPMASELYELVSSSAPVGFTATLDFRTDARYRGGEIGFYLQTPPGYVYYTERDYQPDRATTGGFVHVMLYDSRVTRNAFYFAWEDLYGGGDNDFQDLLMIVDNLVCAGGGARCTVPGAMGACAEGVQQCRSGVLTCTPLGGPSPERCDGVDNDCNGMTDDGMGLCPTSQVCDRGVCVPRCVEGGCFTGQTCSDRGTCVETACATVTCPDGQRCIGGHCVTACDGVYCPPPLSCRLGRCVDACAGVTCDAEDVCEGGTCVPRCQCRRCPAGSVCQPDGHCVPMDCVGVMCSAGNVCRMGHCVDACMPPGTDQIACGLTEMCEAGRCVPRTTPLPDGGMGGGPDGGTGPGFDASADGSRRAPDARRDGAVSPGGAEGDCTCRAPGRRPTRGPGAALLLALLGLALGRRRRAT